MGESKECESMHLKKRHSANQVAISAINTSSSAASRQIVNESKQTPSEYIAKKPDATQKPPAINYPGGVSLIIVFVGLFLAALCVGLVRPHCSISTPF